MTTNIIDAIEACYADATNDGAWLDRVLSVVTPLLARKFGLLCCLYEEREGLIRTTEARFVGGFDARWASNFLARVSRDLLDGSEADPCKDLGFYSKASDYVHRTCVAAHPGSGLIRRTPGLEQLAPIMREFGGAGDLFTVRGLDPHGNGIWIGAPRPLSTRDAPAQVRLFGRLGAHLASGYRLRRTLARYRDQVSRAEAMLSPAGDLLHAQGEAKEREARALLRRAAASIERARSRKGRALADRSSEAWKGLIDARWTLIDHFESDGRRFILAQRNEAEVAQVRGLSGRERQVLAYAKLGLHDKAIAYELGLAHATVRVLLYRARKKLAAEKSARKPV